MPDGDPVNIPIESSFDGRGFDAAAASGQSLGARLKELQAAEQAASAPVTATVSAPGAEQAASDIKKVGDAADEAKERAGGFAEFLKTALGGGIVGGLAAGVAEKAIGGIEGLLEGVVDKFREIVNEGVEVDKSFETLGIGLASALRQADPGKYSDFNVALQASGQLLDVVRAKAQELNIDAESLGHNLQINMLSLVEGGITDLNKQVETTGLLMQAAAAKGITGFQAVRDVMDILNGRASRVILSRELGITDQDIAQAKKAGDLADYLSSKLAAYGEAAAATRETLAGLEQQESNLGKQLAGTFAAGAFDDAKQNARELIDIFKDPTIKEDAAQIGQAYGDALAPLITLKNSLIEGFIDVTAKVLAVLDPLNALTARTKAATDQSAKLGQAFADQTRELQNQIQLATDGTAQAQLRVKIEDDIAAAQAKKATASKEDKELIDQQVTLLQHMLDTLGQTAGHVVNLKGSETERTQNLKDQQDLLKDQETQIEKIDKLLASRDTQDLKNLPPEELQSRINAQMADARALLGQGGLDVPLDATLDPDSIERFRNQLQPLSDTADSQAAFSALNLKIAQTAKDISDLQKAYGESSKAADTAAEKASKAGDKQIEAARKFIDALNDQGYAQNTLSTAQAALHTATTAADADSEAGKKRIKAATDAVTQAEKDLQKAEQDRQDAAKKAFPDELKRLADIATALKNMPVTGDPATADDRAKLINEQNRLNATVAGKPVPGAQGNLDTIARALGLLNADGTPNTAAIPPEYLPNAPGTATPGPADNSQPQPYTGTTPTPQPFVPPAPVPDNPFGSVGGQPLSLGTGATPAPGVPAGGSGPIADFGGGAGGSLDSAGTSLGQTSADLGTAAQTLSTGAATTQQNAGAVQQALTTAQQSDSDYHDTLMTGIAGISGNVDALIAALALVNQTASTQAQTIAQLQLQVQNVANTANT